MSNQLKGAMRPILLILFVVVALLVIRGPFLLGQIRINMGLVAYALEAEEAGISDECLLSAATGWGSSCFEQEPVNNCPAVGSGAFSGTRGWLSENELDGRGARLLAMTQIAEGRLDAATATLHAADVGDDQLGQFMLGNLNMVAGNRVESIAMLGRVRDSEAFYVNLGRLAQRDGNHEKALGCFEDSLQIRPNARSQYYLAQAYADMGDNVEAVKQFETLAGFGMQRVTLSSASQQPAQFLAYQGLGLTAYKMGDWSSAVENIQLAVDLNPHDAVLRSQLALAIYNDSGDLVQALAQATMAATIDPDSIWPALTSGRLLEFEGRFDEALAEFQRAAQINPAAAPPHDHQSQLLQRLGRESEALSALGKAIQLDPNNAIYKQRFCEWPAQVRNGVSHELNCE